MRSPTGRMLLIMFAAVAEFERVIMLERQLPRSRPAT